MRGSDEGTGALFSYVDVESRIRRDHPLRRIWEIANAALAALDGDFEALYPRRLGRPSIPPERLLRAMLLQVFYGLRSERQLMERIEFDLLFRWFVGLGIDEAVWDHSSFSTNRDRLLDGEIAAKFLRAILAQSKVKRLVSSDHFSVDGTLIEAWASIKSFRRKDGSDDDPQGPGRNAERSFHKEKRSNETHAGTTDPEARLYKKGDGQPARLCYIGHVLMENRNGLVVDGGITQASGTAEREAALAMLDRRTGRRRITPPPTRPMTCGSSWSICASGRSPRTSRSTGIFRRLANRARAPSTSGPRGIPAMPSANAAANASRRCSAGARVPPASPKSSCEDRPRSMRYSPSPWPPTI